ncbi:sigma-70 family RNA polymerase sigma factor [Thalassospira indica]|uniref:Sigma-70 family RNA polymerase sigma factor n=1 Tax=Thalassospira indica TaxID=1891279 RepID=A0ABM6Y458_9PROT|nr:sigma-70 family RNA polymerase sigma factor [Thalassospira indica]AXO16800.1 sigma-70 family RNA polymerase sigma factor [Thalassospira indica]OAZ09272.1 hypothetical protein TH15_20620 [Thalassospira profundimaris]
MLAERRGDTGAYSNLLDEIARSLRRTIPGKLIRMGIDPQETEDIIQEILIGLHNKRHTWDSNRPFKPWLAGIVRYKLTDAVRRLFQEKAKHADIEIEELTEMIGTTPDPSKAIDAERNLAKLPPQQHEVVKALVLEGQSVRATAEKLDRSEAAVRVTFSRALSRLFTISRSD